MKTLRKIAQELREQVEEATDPKEPSKLRDYTQSLRDGMDSLVSLLSEDPTIAALALHGQIKFEKTQFVQELAERGVVVKDDYLLVKPLILVRPAAHAAVKAMETAQLEEVLAAAVVANFILATNKTAQKAQKEEEEQYESVS